MFCPMFAISHGEEDTKKIAEEIAKGIKSGDVLALYGDLGSGKTTFTKFLAEQLGVKENVTSPTFVIEKRYKVKKQKTNNKLQIAKLIHIDCYRMDEKNVDKYYLGEIFKSEDAVIVLEWPEKIEKYLPKNAKMIKFEYIGENERKIEY